MPNKDAANWPSWHPKAKKQARRKTSNRREWIAIVTVGDDPPRPIVIQNDELDGPAVFSGPEEIERLSEKHILSNQIWAAFCFTSGEVVVF